MRTSLAKLLFCLMFCTACGGRQATRDTRPLKDDVEAALAELPPAKAGDLWADGFGPTARDAVLDARRAVSEQITSSVRSELRTEENEANGEGGRSTEVRTHVTTQFDHAELLRTRGLVERPGGFAARVALDRGEAIATYQKDLDGDGEKLAKLVPIVERALAEQDTAILLNSEYSAGVVLADIRHRARIIKRLGGTPKYPEAGPARVLERRAAKFRSGVIVRLSVDGPENAGVRRAASSAISKQLVARGCHVTPEDELVDPNAPLAEALLTVHLRDHREQDLKWRYLGVELRVVDGKSGKALFEFVRAPAYVHGGGPSWVQADRNVGRRLRERLEKDGKAGFRGITCR